MENVNTILNISKGGCDIMEIVKIIINILETINAIMIILEIINRIMKFIKFITKKSNNIEVRVFVLGYYLKNDKNNYQIQKKSLVVLFISINMLCRGFILFI